MKRSYDTSMDSGHIGSRETSFKRARDDEDEAEASDRCKRTRQHSISDSGDVFFDAQVFWADYVCDDGDDNDDSSYAPSTGSSEDDDAGMTQQEIFESRAYQNGRIEKAEYVSGDLTSDSECFEDDSDDGMEIRWKDYPSQEGSDSDDPDYIPPSWNFEDILEIISPSLQGMPYYQELDRMRYMNEVIERGPMSEAGVTTDSDSGGYDSSSLRRGMGVFEIPQHLKHYSTLPAYLRRPIHGLNDDEPLLDLRKVKHGWYGSYARALIAKADVRRAGPRSEIYDMEDCLNTILTTDQLQYAFDDWEWKAFENMRLPSSSKHSESGFSIPNFQGPI